MYNTSNLLKHLKAKHPAEYREFTSTTVERQPTLEQMLAKREKMSRDNPRALKITDALAEYIALDDQPLSVVDNLGFRRLLCILEPRYEIPSRNHITDTVLPKLHDFTKKHIRNLLQDVKTLSFTTDIWSSSVSPLSH